MNLYGQHIREILTPFSPPPLYYTELNSTIVEEEQLSISELTINPQTDLFSRKSSSFFGKFPMHPFRLVQLIKDER